MATVQHRSRMQDIVFGAARMVDVVTVHSSWWHTRAKQGVHVLKPTEEKLKLAKDLARRLGTYTVYVYEDKPHLHPMPKIR